MIIILEKKLNHQNWKRTIENDFFVFFVKLSEIRVRSRTLVDLNDTKIESLKSNNYMDFYFLIVLI